VRDMKLQYNNEKLVRGLPDAFAQWLAHIRALRYEEAPDYALLHKVLHTLYEQQGGTPTTPYDWETQDEVDGFSCIPGDGRSDKENVAMALALNQKDNGAAADDSDIEETTDDDSAAPPAARAPVRQEGALDASEQRSATRRRGRCVIL